MIKLYNTLKRKKEAFKPIKKTVGLYSCGPTVYWYAHLGNLRSYIFADVLKRVLEYNKYKVNHIINITDVGHLTSDQDSGEDKMELGAKRENKTAQQIAQFYTKAFISDIKALNIQAPNKWTKATDYIKEQIDLIKLLEKKGYTYQISDGIYFDTSKIKEYGKLTGSLKRTHQARIKKNKAKKRETDFALWKFSNTKRQMEWNSPWGKGFPGWHTECVAMAIATLKIPFDIHTGGIDHIPIHHTNEIAQSQAIYKNSLANFWMHNEFLTADNKKLSKSKGNIIILNKIIKKGINPLAYRYLTLTTHYRSKLSFSWQSLESAQNALNNLYEKVSELKESSISNNPQSQKEFLKYINNDLDTPKALALMWKLIKAKKISSKEIIKFDRIFGLNLDKIKTSKIPVKIKDLIKQRDQYRENKDWKQSDKIRSKIESLGYTVEDSKDGTKIK